MSDRKPRRFLAIFLFSNCLILPFLECSEGKTSSAEMLLSNCQVILILPSVKPNLRFASSYLRDIPSSSMRRPHAIIRPGGDTLAINRRFIIHRLPGSTVTRHLIQHGDHCAAFLFAVNKHSAILSQNTTTYGHPAEDNYIFVGTERIINDFVSIPSNRADLHKIKFKFTAIVTYSGMIDRSLSYFGLYISGMHVGFEFLISRKNSPVSIEIIRNPPVPSFSAKFKSRIINGAHLSGSALVVPLMFRLGSAGEASGGI